MMEFATRTNAALVNASIACEARVQLNAICGSQPGTTVRSKLCVDLSDKRVSAALECRPPCRFQVLHVMCANSKERKVIVVLDVAHHPHAIDRLIRLLHKQIPDKTIRFYVFSADKDIAKVLEHITAFASVQGIVTVTCTCLLIMLFCL